MGSPSLESSSVCVRHPIGNYWFIDQHIVIKPPLCSRRVPRHSGDYVLVEAGLLSSILPFEGPPSPVYLR